MLDSKQSRIVTIAKPDIPLHMFIKKGLNLRLEYADELNNESEVWVNFFKKTIKLKSKGILCLLCSIQ